MCIQLNLLEHDDNVRKIEQLLTGKKDKLIAWDTSGYAFNIHTVWGMKILRPSMGGVINDNPYITTPLTRQCRFDALGFSEADVPLRRYKEVQ